MFFKHCCLVVLAVSLMLQSARADDSKEYLVKAAFLFNFVKFIEWPADRAIGLQSKIDICVLGDTPMSHTANVFNAASTPKLALSLVQENNVNNIASHCHVVFISKTRESNLPAILATLRNQPVLLVSDMEGFVQSGGMIGFVLSDNKIKIDVNKSSVTASGLRIDAQLLEIAHEVVDK
jgi:hypothetical protein